jgi:hypothetical protein
MKKSLEHIPEYVKIVRENSGNITNNVNWSKIRFGGIPANFY